MKVLTKLHARSAGLGPTSGLRYVAES